ncbi:MAG: hypothetical protein QOI04_2241 [Verrucomicrobiota bacterium]|jgi:hypothetical protein
MNPFPQKAPFYRGLIASCGLLAVLIAFAQPTFAEGDENSPLAWMATAGGAAVSPSLQNTEGQRTVAIKSDHTISCPLKEGDSTFVIALPKSTLLDRLTFINENGTAQGELHIAVSNYRLPAESPKWNAVDGSVHFAHKRLFNLSLLGVEAKYVRLSFHVDNAGRIAALRLRGTDAPENLGREESRVLQISNPLPSGSDNDNLSFALTDLRANSRILYISSGPSSLATRMIDENPATSFDFSLTDPQPTVVVELAGEARSQRVSALYKGARGHLEVFILKNFPASSRHVDLTGLKPIAVTIERASAGRTVATFDPQGARLVALRWTLDSFGYADNDPKSVVTLPANGEAGPLEVAEIGAFDGATLGMIYPAELIAANNPQLGDPLGEIPIVPVPSP